jgi:hypothetical protein
MMANNELKRRGKKWSWSRLRYYHGICQEELRKTTKLISQDIRDKGRYLKREPLGKMAEAFSLFLAL